MGGNKRIHKQLAASCCATCSLTTPSRSPQVGPIKLSRARELESSRARKLESESSQGRHCGAMSGSSRLVSESHRADWLQSHEILAFHLLPWFRYGRLFGSPAPSCRQLYMLSRRLLSLLSCASSTKLAVMHTRKSGFDLLRSARLHKLHSQERLQVCLSGTMTLIQGSRGKSHLCTCRKHNGIDTAKPFKHECLCKFSQIQLDNNRWLETISAISPD